MFKISESGWNKLDKEMERISDSVVPHMGFLAELFPTSEGINFKETVSNFLKESNEQCKYEFDSHEDHGAVSCDTDVTSSLSDLIKRIVAYLSSSHNFLKRKI